MFAMIRSEASIWVGGKRSRTRYACATKDVVRDEPEQYISDRAKLDSFTVPF